MFLKYWIIITDVKEVSFMNLPDGDKSKGFDFGEGVIVGENVDMDGLDDLLSPDVDMGSNDFDDEGFYSDFDDSDFYENGDFDEDVEKISNNEDSGDVGVESKTENEQDDLNDNKESTPQGYNDENLIENEAAMAKTLSLNTGGIKFQIEDDEDEEKDTGESKDTTSAEERLRYFANKIMSCMIGKKEIRKYALSKLLSVASPRIFRDENYILFSVLYEFRDRVARLNIDSEFIRLFLNRNRKLLTKSRGYIDLNAYGDVEGSAEVAYIGGVVKHFNRLNEMEDMSEEEFETVFEKYLIEFKSLEASRVYAQANVILTEGMKIGNKSYFGFEDSNNFIKRRLSEIEGLVDMNAGSGFVSMKEVIMGEKGEQKKSYKISDFGKLKKLNEIYGGIYTGMFYQVIGGPKSGKSKLCARICHTAILDYGTNVTVWAAEGGYEAWTAQMRAIHFDYTYNTGVDVTDKKFGIDQDTIIHNKYPSDELRELEESSALDLVSNSDYGVVDYVDRPFVVENFLEDIDASVKSNGSKLIIIDYPQLIGSNNRVSERERIADSYKKLLMYCRTNNVALFVPAQYTQETLKELISKKDTSDSDMRTSGGGSSEVLRTPDYSFAMWATTQDLINNSMKFLSMPCRFNKAFPEISAYIDLGTCQFISIDD